MNPSPGWTRWTRTTSLGRGARFTTTRPRASARYVRTPAIPSGSRPRDRWNRLQRSRGRHVEASVDPLHGEPEPAQAELERRHVPPDVATTERALTEQGPAQRAELAACGETHLPRRLDPVLLLERHDARAGQGPGNPVDLPVVEIVRAQGNLERSDLGALRSDSRPGERQGCERRDDDHDDSMHGTEVLRRTSARSSREHAATIPGRCLPR